jgi:hypothetical protein
MRGAGRGCDRSAAPRAPAAAVKPEGTARRL